MRLCTPLINSTRAYDADTKRLLKERRRGYAALYNEQRRHERRHVDATVAAGELGRLLARQPEMLSAANAGGAEAPSE